MKHKQNYLGRLLFPRHAAWQQHQKLKTMLWVVVVAVIFSAVVAGFIIVAAFKQPQP